MDPLEPDGIGIVSPGEMGAAMAGALVTAGRSVRWASDGRSAATRERAMGGGLKDVRSLAALAESSSVILSICPPQSATRAAESLGHFGGVYVDANAIAPGTARAVASVIEKAGGTYVDGGIIGPPPLTAGTTRLYLSGPRAPAVADLFAGTAVEARPLSGGPTAASALKMAYAGWTKGSAALLLAVAAAARQLGVSEELAAEWALSQPDLAARLAAAQQARSSKGWRWAPEMDEIAQTLAELGLPAGFHLAAAEVFQRDAD